MPTDCPMASVAGDSPLSRQRWGGLESPMSASRSRISATSSFAPSPHRPKAMKRKPSAHPTAADIERDKREYIEALWSKPRREAVWGTTDTDMLRHFKVVPGKDYDRFRSLRRTGLWSLSAQDPRESLGLVKEASVNTLEDVPGNIAWQGTLKSLQGDKEGAIAACSEALRQDDRVLRAFWERGSARMSAGDYQGALGDIGEVLGMRKNFFGDWLASGEARLKLKDYAGAIADLSNAISLDARRPPAWKHRATARFATRDYEGTIADCDEALSLEHGDPEVHLLRARCKYELGDFEGCLGDYEVAIKHDPSRPASWFERAEAKIATGDEAGAVRDLAKALHLDPMSIESWRHKARIMLKMQDWRQAMRDATRIILLDPTIQEAWVIRGEAKVMMRDMVGALPDFEEAARLDPTCPLPFYYAAKAKFQKGLYVEAAIDCQHGLEADPRHKRTLALLAKCLDMERRLKDHTMEGLKPHTPRRKGQEHLLALMRRGLEGSASAPALAALPTATALPRLMSPSGASGCRWWICHRVVLCVFSFPSSPFARDATVPRRIAALIGDMSSSAAVCAHGLVNAPSRRKRIKARLRTALLRPLVARVL